MMLWLTARVEAAAEAGRLRDVATTVGCIRMSLGPTHCASDNDLISGLAPSPFPVLAERRRRA